MFFQSVTTFYLGKAQAKPEMDSCLLACTFWGLGRS